MWFSHGVVLSLLVLLLLRASVGSGEKLIPFNDGSIKYSGRWRMTSTEIQSGWPGAYLKTTVRGSRIILRLKRPTTVFVQLDYGPVRLLEAVDGGGRLPIELEVTTFSCLENNSSLGTDDESHELLVAAATETPISLESILIAEEGDTSPPSKISPLLVEFVGHDLSLGIGTTQSLFTSFPWLVSGIVGAEHVQIAYDHARLENRTSYDLGMETRYFDWALSGDAAWWDFSYVPQVIVVLLGRNDRISDEYTDTLVNFLKRVRSRLSDTSILILSEPLGDLVRQSQDAVYRLNDQGDQNVYFVDTTGWVQYGSAAFVDSMHLNDAGHDRLARRLAPLLKARLSSPPQPLPSPTPNPSLPHDWQTMDIGQDESVGLPGSVSFDSPHTFTLWGSGIDVGGNQDAFRFVYQSLSGDGIIEATVESHSAFASCAKAGIMMREHLALGSPHVLFGVSPASGVFTQARSSNFGDTRLIKKLRASPPYRFRLIRQGATFITQSASVEKPTEWQLVANVTDLLFARDIYVGLAVTSCDPSVVSVGKFADISLSGGVGNGFYSTEHQRRPRLIQQP
ncbi:hypothetical protein BX666DRAFT_1909205 [Dichotomocladium elegans]|nr:hypothetical protein BX666DRAFT_1909205 [Dichotomocladium elegans]